MICKSRGFILQYTYIHYNIAGVADGIAPVSHSNISLLEKKDIIIIHRFLINVNTQINGVLKISIIFYSSD